MFKRKKKVWYPYCYGTRKNFLGQTVFTIVEQRWTGCRVVTRTRDLRWKEQFKYGMELKMLSNPPALFIKENGLTNHHDDLDYYNADDCNVNP